MKKKVLTVDDSRTIRNMLLVTLNNAGFETIQAEDGIEGLEVLEQSNPDVIVTDINMPRLDGFRITVAGIQFKKPRFLFGELLLAFLEKDFLDFVHIHREMSRIRQLRVQWHR